MKLSNVKWALIDKGEIVEFPEGLFISEFKGHLKWLIKVWKPNRGEIKKVRIKLEILGEDA